MRGGALPALVGFGLGVFLGLAGPVVWTVLPRTLPDKPAVILNTSFTTIEVLQGLCWALIPGL